MPHTILVVEDDITQRTILSHMLRAKLGHDVVEAESGPRALEILSQEDGRRIHLAIVDHYMPDMDGLELIEVMMQRHPDLPVIMLTGTKDINVAVRVMKAGARDFLAKPPELERLHVSIQNALKMNVLEKEVTRLKRKDAGTMLFEDLAGHDSGLAGVIRVARKAAAADIPVLVMGETGTGKEMIARAIHGESRRAGRPFVAVNCGALPENLVESTLFGHEKGAFTGAVARSVGCFREAEGGTIFLDEVGELPLEAQVKLLRVLQQREITPVGSNKALHVNVRVISATNRDLQKEVGTGRFREDLFFRLNVLPLHMPALRERRGDIPLLVSWFIEKFAAGDGLPLKDLSPEAAAMLSAREWPGNVRELENTIHRALVLGEEDTLVPDDFSGLGERAAMAARPAAISNDPGPAQFSIFDGQGRMKPLEEIEQDVMAFALRLSENNVSQAADMLGMARSTFYRRIKS